MASGAGRGRNAPPLAPLPRAPRPPPAALAPPPLAPWTRAPCALAMRVVCHEVVAFAATKVLQPPMSGLIVCAAC